MHSLKYPWAAEPSSSIWFILIATMQYSQITERVIDYRNCSHDCPGLEFVWQASKLELLARTNITV